jgi:hypothetical protein
MMARAKVHRVVTREVQQHIAWLFRQKEILTWDKKVTLDSAMKATDLDYNTMFPIKYPQKIVSS